MHAAPLEKIRVLDLTRVLAGPWAAQTLSDLGAEVIKVERPDVGDDSRRYGPAFPDTDGASGARQSAMFMAANRGKKSITLDLASPKGQEIVRELIKDVDVLIENYKVGDLERRGLDYASVREINPRLIYCSITGYGQDGPYAARGGYDPVVQAMSGMMSVTGLPDDAAGGGPMKAGPSLFDIFTGLYAVIAIQSALYERDTVSGEGQHIDLALLDVAVSVMSQQAMHYVITGTSPGRMGSAMVGGAPGGCYRCADGDIVISPGNDAAFRDFCGALGLDELAADPHLATNASRVQHRDALEARLKTFFATRPVADIHVALNDVGVPNGPVLDMAQMFDDPQVKHRGLVQPSLREDGRLLHLIRSPFRYSRSVLPDVQPPPSLGEHTLAVLGARLALSEDDIGILRAEGTI